MLFWNLNEPDFCAEIGPFMHTMINIKRKVFTYSYFAEALLCIIQYWQYQISINITNKSTINTNCSYKTDSNIYNATGKKPQQSTLAKLMFASCLMQVWIIMKKTNLLKHNNQIKYCLWKTNLNEHTRPNVKIWHTKLSYLSNPVIEHHSSKILNCFFRPEIFVYRL